MRAQRAHQQNVEVTSGTILLLHGRSGVNAKLFSRTVFLPLLIVAGLNPSTTLQVATAGAFALGFRVIGTLGYSLNLPLLRRVGGLWHVAEVYVVYLAGRFVVELIYASNVAFRA